MIISIVKINKNCTKHKNKYIFLSIFIPIIVLFIYPKAKPNKYEPISTNLTTDPNITHIKAKDEEDAEKSDTTSQHITHIKTKDEKNQDKDSLNKN